MSFDTLGLRPEILRALADLGYQAPSPIQQAVIPVALAGQDVLAAAQTGTGKTAGFSLPVIERLAPFANTSTSPARHPTRALILAPTRELAIQVEESVKVYCKYLPLRTCCVYGGVNIATQTVVLREGVEILVATPGRLLDHVQGKTVNLSQVNMLVLDEADRMLDMGFMPDLRRIVDLLPAQRQSLMFSATFPQEIEKLAGTMMRDPQRIEVARRNATAENVTQRVHPVHHERKRALLVHLIQSRDLHQVLIFTGTKQGANRLANELNRASVQAEAIHGDKTQGERLRALEAFKCGEARVLVATDVAARGLDIEALPYVINYDLPHSAEDYVHRIGRTGRAGASGEAISLVSEDENRYLRDIEKLIGKTLLQEIVDGYAPHAAEVPDFRKPAAERPPRSDAGDARVETPAPSRRDHEASIEQPDAPLIRKPVRQVAALFKRPDRGQ
jgi:ATP-dependent RNA helicase RhlE